MPTPWAYQVDYQEQIVEQEAILRRLDAQTAAGLNPDARQEPDRLAAWSVPDAARMGLSEVDRAAMCAWLEVDGPDNLPANWYARGKAISTDLVGRFGHTVYPAAERAQERRDALRRLSTAKRKMRITS
jgi:hypothetical protein